ncbi:MAG: multisubunit potassium/proton antiporter, PhaE subunit [Polaromonas sp.]|nr:multisubunit potassium/proton antiporter, PhaE subunit [Polaromonas sp.]
MKRLLPAPLLSLALFALWLLLNRTLDIGHLLLALVLALAIPVFTAGLRPVPVRMRRPGLVLGLVVRVLADSLRSNLALARLLLRPGGRRHPAGFVQVPLDLRDPNGLVVLAMIVCLTPGTAWAELSRDRTVLLLHALEVDDAHAMAALVKARYEQPLMEIFEP